MQNAEPFVFLHNLEVTMYTVVHECHLSVCALGQLVALKPTAACLPTSRLRCKANAQ